MKKTVAPSSKRSFTHPENAEPRGNFSSRGADFNDLLRHLSPVVSAVLVDAGFFLKRAKVIFGEQSPDEAAQKLHEMAIKHLYDDNGRRPSRLYRIFVYDAPPVKWKGHTALRKKPFDTAESEISKWHSEFHNALRSLRKVALRMGEIPANQVRWQVRHDVLKDLMTGKRPWSDLKDDDFRLDMRQKGVDMRLGLDIASLSFKRQVNQIILISGDADFVPAAKLARREGIDFILDPMWATIRPDLHEHIDGLRSVCKKPGIRSKADEKEPFAG